MDNIKTPEHYMQHPSGIECLEITRHMTFNLGNAIKYIWRADYKGTALQDLYKAVEYIEDEIKTREVSRLSALADATPAEMRKVVDRGLRVMTSDLYSHREALRQVVQTIADELPSEPRPPKDPEERRIWASKLPSKPRRAPKKP